MANTPTGEGTRLSAGVVGLVSLVLGVAATAGQVHPTAYAAWDVVLVGVFAGVCIWASSTAPWWAIGVVGLAGLAAAARQQQWWLVGLATVAVVLAVVEWKRPHPLVAALSTAVSIATLSRLEGGPFFGGTAIYVIVLLGALAVIGLIRQPPRPRKLVLIACGGFALVMVIGAVGFGLAAMQAKSSLEHGNDQTRDGLDLMRDGDFIGGSFLLQQANSSFAEAQDDLDQPWALLGRLVPVVAQNRRTAVQLVDTAEDVTGAAANAASQIDPEALRVKNGTIDVDAVLALATPVAELNAAIGELNTTLEEPISPWVPDQLADRITDLRDDTDGYQTRIDNLSLAVNAAPGLLGADGKRTYFVAFSTPAETRSIGGFVGSYALLTIDDGTIALTEFGRSDDLRLAAPVDGMDIDLPDDFLSRYGAFNFEDPQSGKVQPTAWKNIAITPDFPTMSSVVEQMYRATYGKDIDGVILMDPYPLATLLEYTGPQVVASYNTPIDSSNAVDFILREQYLTLAQEERVDLLAVLAQQTLTALLDGALPSPITVAQDLGPFVGQHRLMMWTNVESEQAMLDAVGLSGRFPPAEGDADFGVTFNNAAPNKVDAYLTHSTTATQRFDADLGVDVVDVTIDLTNSLTDVTLPEYVVGNSAGLPPGTAYLYLSVYSPGELISAQRDGEALGAESDVELGLNVAAGYVDIAPGASTSITFTFEAPGPEPAGGWRIFVAPTAQPDP